MPEEKTVYLCQSDYIEMMFSDFAFAVNVSITTPMDDKFKLTVLEEVGELDRGTAALCFKLPIS